jgi:hypothetical protein
LLKFIAPTRQYHVNYDFVAFMCSATDVKLVIYRFVNFNPKTGQFIGFNGEHFGHLGLQQARDLFAADLKVSEQAIDSIQRMDALIDIRFLVADLQLMHRRYVPEVWKP